MMEFYSNRLLQYTAKVKKLRLVIDWTTLQENFMLLSISLITKKGRTIPIAYDGYKQGELREGKSQSSIEEDLLKKIIETIPMSSRKRITVIADRGFDRPDVKDILHEYSLRWEIESMFKSKKNLCVGMSWKYAKLTTIDRWLRFVFLITILFQFLADVGIFCDDDISIIKRYTPVANPKRRIFSIYNLALKVIKGLGRIFNIFINQFDELIIRPV